MSRLVSLCSALALICAASPVRAGDFWAPPAVAWYWCLRDGIYANTRLINHLEANPDVDDAVKGPPIVAARAEIHRLRALLGPVYEVRAEPCCYSRRRLYVR